MKIKPGFNLETENGQTFITCDKSINPDYNASIFLNDRAVFLWKMLQNGNTTKNQMLNGLLEKFDISTVLALNDIDLITQSRSFRGWFSFLL